MVPFLLFIVIPIGTNIPWQVFARSPGFMSTCNEYKHLVQWSREDESSGGTWCPQWAQTNPASFFAKRLLTVSVSIFGFLYCLFRSCGFFGGSGFFCCGLFRWNSCLFVRFDFGFIFGFRFFFDCDYVWIAF